MSPLLGPDSSPEVSVTPGQQCGDQVAGVASDANNNEELDSDSDTGLIKLW